MDLSELTRYVVEVLERLDVPYFITGSIASMAYGESRFTNDIDIVADLAAYKLSEFVRAFPPSDFYLSAEAAGAAIAACGQFNIIHPESGLKIDVMIPQPKGVDRTRLSRARRLRAGPDFAALFSSPEDLILKKMDFYREGGSEKHLRDITGMLKSGRMPIDNSYIAEQARALGLADVWDAVLKRVGP